MRILCFGSLNMDHVYQVSHIARPGETIHSHGYAKHLGGKGLNQSVALARAGARVCHAGCIGPDGEGMRDWLLQNGVDTRFVRRVDVPSGQAIIQVDRAGNNCIVLFSGANACLDRDWIDEVYGAQAAGDWVLLQNEVNELAYLIESAHRRGLRIALNPSPISDGLRAAPLDLVDLFLLNEIEGEALSGQTVPARMIDALRTRYPGAAFVLTLGEKGAMYADKNARLQVDAVPVEAVDTTAAGDTFTGYFLAAWMQAAPPEEALRRAARAAAIAVSRVGASPSIPHMDEL